MIKKCKSCQKEVDPKGIKCPHRGTNQRNWFNRYTNFIGIVIVVTLRIIGGFRYFTSSNQMQVVQNQPTPTPSSHDNSGAGSTEENSPIQDHIQRALQHLGFLNVC